jgi:hypothetical protein
MKITWEEFVYRAQSTGVVLGLSHGLAATEVAYAHIEESTPISDPVMVWRMPGEGSFEQMLEKEHLDGVGVPHR